ncbi:MAG: tetratricopeptide repeat protein [Candidatus Omnitrophica bacterium]|nr:tetratricopeptide repeat protein [Candidatus Omnitrophota bacterium]
MAETKAREVAEQRRAESEIARAAEAEARAVAERRRAEVEAIHQLILSDALGGADPDFAQGREVSVREVLENASAKVAGAFADNPLLEAAIRQTIGSTYAKLSLSEKAVPHLEAASEIRRRKLGDDHPETLLSRQALGQLRVWERKWDEAKQILEDVYARQQRILGEDHPDTLETLYWIFDNLDHSGSAKPAELEQIAREAHVKALKRHGPEHPITIKLLQALQAALNRAAGSAATPDRTKKLAEALALSEELVAVRKRTAGPAHTWTLYAMLEHSDALSMSGRAIEAEQLRYEIMAAAERAFGPAHKYVNIVSQRLAFHCFRTGRHAESAEHFIRLAGGAITAVGYDGQNAVSFIRQMADYVLELGYVEAVERFAMERLPDARRRLAADSPGLMSLLYALGAARLAQDQPAEAERLLREVYAFDAKRPGVGRHYSECLLARALIAQGRSAEAEPLLRAAVEGIEASTVRASERATIHTRNALKMLVELPSSQPDAVAKWNEKLAEIEKRAASRAPRRPVPASVLDRKTPINLLFDSDETGERMTTVLPSGWYAIGNRRDHYTLGIDRTEVQQGSTSGYVKFTGSDSTGFGGMAQSFSAANYLGKRVRFSAWIKTRILTGRVHLYLRVDRQDSVTLAFDNMNDRAVTRDAEWAQYATVLDVPPVAASLNFGFFLAGSGQAWVSDIRLEAVGQEVPTTGPSLMLAPPVPAPR